MTVTVIEPTTALRDHMRGVTGLGVGVRVYAGGLPAAVVFPAVSFFRVTGGAGVVDEGEYQFDCWADSAPSAAQLASDVAGWLINLIPVDIGAVQLCGATVDAMFPVVDPDDPDIHRYTITAQVVTKPAAP